VRAPLFICLKFKNKKMTQEEFMNLSDEDREKGMVVLEEWHHVKKYVVDNIQPGDLITIACGGNISHGIFRRFTDRSVQYYNISKWVLQGKPHVAYINVVPGNRVFRIAKGNMDTLNKDFQIGYHICREHLIKQGLIK
jgi:hypothetical protein